MNGINRVFNIRRLVLSLNNHGLLQWMNDAANTELIYYMRTGQKLDLHNPKTFNEKLQWLKVYDHNPRYSMLVDKIAAKKSIGDLIGKEYIVPLIGEWERAEDINFDSLPDRYVLKCNHDQGSVVIVTDAKKLDKDETVSFFKKRLRKNVYASSREYAYRDIKPKVFAEELLGDAITDYKFYCFNGEPKFLYVCRGIERLEPLKMDFFDMEFKPMPFYRTDHLRLGIIPQPQHFEEMKNIARTLAQDTKFVRIDLFEENNKVYFSEYTLIPASGYAKFQPPEYDAIIGDWLKLDE